MLQEAYRICRGVHEAAVGTEGEERGSLQTRLARVKTVRLAEEIALESWARVLEVWIEPEEFAERYEAGGGAEEGEARVYFDTTKNVVVKANDGSMHGYWRDFMVRLALHNWVFTESPCELIGFTRRDGFFGPKSFAAVFQQPFLRGTFATRTEVEAGMKRLGFRRTRNDDYEHAKWGLVCEDLHGENVLIRDIDGKLGVFDPIFFVKPDSRAEKMAMKLLEYEDKPKMVKATPTGRKSRRTEPQIGIFWVYKSRVIGMPRPWRKCEVGMLGIYDSPDTHVDAWEQERIYLPDYPELTDTDYEQLPRGRIVYFAKEDNYVVYLDARINTTALHKKIVRCFKLDEKRTAWQEDDHYRPSPA